MRSVILLTIVLKCCIELHCLPLPAGQIIKYRVSSKYFNRNNQTNSDEHSRESLYNLLTKIHFGDATQFSTTMIESATEQTTEVEMNEETETKMTTNESPETPTTMMDVTEQQEEQTERATVYDNILNDLIEQVVNEEMEKIAADGEKMANSPNFDIAQSTDVYTEREALNEPTEALSNDEIAPTTTTASIVDHDSRTEAESISTSVPSNGEKIHEELQVQPQQHEDEEEREPDNGISESLLNAVGDLLSSVLGISVDNIDETDAENSEPNTNESVAENENLDKETTENDIVEHSTEYQSGIESMAAADDSKMTDIDEKIENLNEQNTFMTENAQEFFTEAIKNSENNEEILEVIPPVESDATQPDSIDASVNQIMNLVKGAAKNADKQIKDVYTTFKEIGTSLGITGIDVDDVEDETKMDPIGSFDPETVKSFETDINEMMSSNGNSNENDNFVPNVAKAAMYYKYQYDDDF